MALSKPIFLKTADVTLTIGTGGAATVAQCQVHSVAFVPDVPDLERYVTLCGAGGAVSQGRPTWSAEMTIAQAWGAEDLARLLWEHAGEEGELLVQIHGEGTAAAPATPAVRATVLLVPGPYGGEAETWLEQELVLPCTTDPELLEAPPAGSILEAVAA